MTLDYERTPVLSDVTLTIRQAEVHALLGPNGAGKTTLVRAILGRIAPQAGRATLAAGGIGLVPQDLAIYPALTIAENLRAFARLAGEPSSDVDARIRTLVRLLDLGARLNQRVASLSGGWQRRVNIAAALLNAPSLLILDEPTVGVDKASRDAIHQVLRDLSAAGTAILLVTHDFAEAEAICTHAIVLGRGRCLTADEIATLVRSPFDEQVRLGVEASRVFDETFREILARHGFQDLTGRSTHGLAPPDRAMEVARNVARILPSLHRLTLERPGLQALYQYHVGGAE